VTESLASGLAVPLAWRLAELEPRLAELELRLAELELRLAELRLAELELRLAELIGSSTDGAPRALHRRDTRGDPGGGEISTAGVARELP
jgi:hypothetical protein